MKQYLQKGGVLLVFFITTIIAADGQTTAHISILTESSFTGTAGEAAMIAGLADTGRSWNSDGSVSGTTTAARNIPSGTTSSRYTGGQGTGSSHINSLAPPLYSSSTFAEATKASQPLLKSTGDGLSINQQAAVAGGPDAALKDLDIGTFNTPFVKCRNNLTGINYTVNVQNISATKSTNQSYRIDWGDGEADNFASSFDITSHTYKVLGTFNMVLTVTGTDGSTASETYKVYNGRSPNLTMGSPDHSGGCAPQTYVFPIGGVANNSPNTTYTFTFDDGTPPLVYTHETIPSSITHIFDQSSCSRPGDVFTLTGRAENPCGSTEVTVVSRKIGSMPKVGFTVARETVCTDQNIAFNNTTQDGSSITNTGECEPLSVYEWTIVPATGWTLTSGDNTSKNIDVKFTATGTYRVTLVSGNQCGSEELTREITVVPPPKAVFTINQAEACNNLTVATTNTSEGTNLTYTWQVSPNSGYTLRSGTLSSTNPVFDFTAPGKYTITLSASTGCTPSTATQEVVVKGKPLVTLPRAQTHCGPQALKFDAANSAHAPVYNANNSTITGYTWSVTGNATFVPPTNRHSQYPEINFPAAGTYTVTLKAASACGESEAATQLITIEEDKINNKLGSDEQVCFGQPVSITSGTTPTGGSGSYTYLWESSNTSATTGFAAAEGPNTAATYTSGALTQTTWFRRKVTEGNCTSISNAIKAEVMPAITGNLITGEQTICGEEEPAMLTGDEPTGGLGPGSFTYTWEYSITDAATGFQAIQGATDRDYKPKAFAAVTWFRRVASSGNCQATSPVVQVTVNPLPDPPEVTAPEICAGSNAVITVASHTGTCEWFSDETSTTALIAGHTFDTPVLNSTTTYYVQVTNALGCSTPRIPVTVTVYPLTTVNTISANQLLCTGEKPEGLTGSTPTGGDGTYSFSWEQSTDNITYTAATGINTSKDYQPPMLTKATWYRRRVVSNNCENISDPVQIVVNSPISNNSISANQNICTGSIPATLEGTIPSGGGSNYTYLWEYSTTDATTGFAPAPGLNDGADYIPENLTQTTWFRRKITSPPCRENVSDAVVIIVEPQPDAPQAKGATICPSEKAILTATALLPSHTLEWFREQEGGIPLHRGETYTTDPLLATTDFYVQTLNQIGCPSKRTRVTATVVEPLVDAGPDITMIQKRGAQLNASGGETYSWSPSGTLSDPNIPDPLANPEETTTYTVTVTTSEGCTFTDEVTVTVLPKIEITNAITVNGDGLNDTWFIRNIESYPDCHVQVFTRWGAKIFDSVGYKVPWDGTHQGRELPMSAYYYIIKLNEKEDALTGSITLIK